jgi:peptidoglycan/LPS O-acetylase OafA/YrhL
MHDKGRQAPEIRGGQVGSIVLRYEVPQQSPLPNKRMSDSAPASTLKGYIPTLDGWRAIAILGVMASHAGHSYSAAHGRESFFDRVASGTHGVNLFFAISGLLITSRLLEEWDSSGGISLKRFYIRRAFRILPPALLYLSCVALLGAIGLLPVVREEFVAATLFFRNYLPVILGSNGAGFFTSHYWSLGVEEHFYLFWPALLLLAGRKRALPVAIIIAIAIAAWRHVEAWREIMLYNAIQPTYFARSDTRIDSIMWGVVVALALSRPEVRAWVERYLSTIAYLALVALYGVIVYRYGTRPTFWEAAIVPLLIVGTVLRPHSVLGRVLENPAMRWIGRLSYSLYLWEFFFVYYAGVPTTLGVWQSFPLNLIASVACAAASYYLVERPLIRVGHRLAPAMPRDAMDRASAAPEVLAATA